MNATKHRQGAAPALGIRPLKDRVVVEPREAPKQTPGGLHLPDRPRDGRITRGTVVASHPDSALKAGDDVFVPEYGGSEVDLDGRRLFVYKEEQVLAVVET